MAEATAQEIQPSQENAASTSHVASVAPTDEKKVALPETQVPGAPAVPLAWPPPPQEPLQLQLLPISRPPGLCTLELLSRPLQFGHLCSGRRIGRREIPHSGQASKAAIEAFPLKAEF